MTDYKGPERRRSIDRECKERMDDVEKRLTGAQMQINRVVSEIESEAGTFTRVGQSIKKRLHEHDTHFYGLPGSDNPGLLVRMDRLETAARDVKFIKHGIIMALLGLVVNMGVVAWGIFLRA